MNKPSAESVWRWISVSLGSIVVAGASSVVTSARNDSRLTQIEHSIIRIQDQQELLTERQARDRAEVIERLQRIEQFEKNITTYIMGKAQSTAP